MTHVRDADAAEVSARKAPSSGVFERWETAELYIMQENLLIVFFASDVQGTVLWVR